jgi:hypothetical protein
MGPIHAKPQIRLPISFRGGPKESRRAMIRRRGKRGRIRRAGTTEAYENRTQLTNDARIQHKGAPKRDNRSNHPRAPTTWTRAEGFWSSSKRRHLAAGIGTEQGDISKDFDKEE